jgi:NAD(P)-dependent dehydrogenase (short-subunit alcohol dehydrogenase family)
VRVHVGARLDRAGAAVLIGFPPEESEHMADDKMLREMTSDPKFRKILVTDGKTEVGQALVKALVKAGAEIVWVGHAEPWKKLPGLDDITALQPVTLVPLDLTNGRSVGELAGEIGGKVDIVVNNAEVHRAFGIAARRGTDAAKAEMDINYFGLLRLAQEFGPALKGRSADGETHAAAWVNLLSVYALSNYPPHGTFSASKAAAYSLAQCLRAEMRPSGIRVDQHLPRADRRRVEPEPAAAEGRARRARERDRQGAEGRHRGRLPGRRRAGVGRALAREPEGAGAGAGGGRLSASGRSCRPAAGRRAPPRHSISSSARNSAARGIVRPIARAERRLMTCSIRVGSSTGSSAGFAPRNTRSMNDASRR